MADYPIDELGGLTPLQKANKPNMDTLAKYSELGFRMQNVSLDLHNSGFEGNIVTEYEQRFLDLGQPIYRLEAINIKE